MVFKRNIIAEVSVLLLFLAGMVCISLNSARKFSDFAVSSNLLEVHQETSPAVVGCRLPSEARLEKFVTGQEKQASEFFVFLTDTALNSCLERDQRHSHVEYLATGHSPTLVNLLVRLNS